jgi:DNA invertase Pin-like site-specific DNA recombinase
MKIGYARVSSNDQDLALQNAALVNAKCDLIFTDKISGVKSSRPGLNTALSHLKPGDTLVTWKLDRLGRSLKNLISLCEELGNKGIFLHFLTEGIDTQTSIGMLYFHLIGAFAEFERNLIRERTMAGLEIARMAGRIGGRPRIVTPEKYASMLEMLNAGTPYSEVAKSHGISKPSIYRYFPSDRRNPRIRNKEKYESMLKMLNAGSTYAEVAEYHKVSLATVYSYFPRRNRK